LAPADDDVIVAGDRRFPTRFDDHRLMRLDDECRPSNACAAGQHLAFVDRGVVPGAAGKELHLLGGGGAARWRRALRFGDGGAATDRFHLEALGDDGLALEDEAELLSM